jgi:hypothetical protein
VQVSARAAHSSWSEASGGGQQWSLREISAKFLNNGHPIGGEKQQKPAATSSKSDPLWHAPPPTTTSFTRSPLQSNF